MSRRSVPRVRSRSLRSLAIVLLPAGLGGCACFSPVLKAADAALTAIVPTAAAEQPLPPRITHPVRVKGYVKTEAKAPGRPIVRAKAEADRAPRVAPTRIRAPDPAATADEADAAAVADESERLALADAAARIASEKAVADAHAMMLKGEVQAARQRLVAAMNGSNALVVLAFARTFDPNELAKLARADAPADPARALALYEHARQLGSKDAETAMKRLAASTPTATPSPPSPPGAQPAPAAAPVTVPAAR